jgi:cation transporter-like permease
MKVFAAAVVVALNLTGIFVAGAWTYFMASGPLGAPHAGMTDAEWRELALQSFQSALPSIAIAGVITFVVNYVIGRFLVEGISFRRDSKRILRVCIAVTLTMLLLLFATAVFASVNLYRTKPPYFD